MCNDGSDPVSEIGVKSTKKQGDEILSFGSQHSYLV